MPHQKALMTNYHHKIEKHTDNISVYKKACHIDFLASMKSSKSITFYTQIHQFCDNQSQKKLRLTTFSWKSPKKILGLLKDTQNSLSLLFKYCVKSGKTMLDSSSKNRQVNLQPTLNKRAGGLTIFVTDYSSWFPCITKVPDLGSWVPGPTYVLRPRSRVPCLTHEMSPGFRSSSPTKSPRSLVLGIGCRFTLKRECDNDNNIQSNAPYR